MATTDDTTNSTGPAAQSDKNQQRRDDDLQEKQRLQELRARGEEGDILTEEDERILDQVWAKIAAQRAAAQTHATTLAAHQAANAAKRKNTGQ